MDRCRGRGCAAYALLGLATSTRPAASGDLPEALAFDLVASRLARRGRRGPSALCRDGQGRAAPARARSPAALRDAWDLQPEGGRLMATRPPCSPGSSRAQAPASRPHPRAPPRPRDKQDVAFDELLLMLLPTRSGGQRRGQPRARGRPRPPCGSSVGQRPRSASTKRGRVALEAHRHVILGPVGVGKTFVASALGPSPAATATTSASPSRPRLFEGATEPLRPPATRDDRSTSVDLLIIDDFALEPMTKEESKTSTSSSSSAPVAPR